jgi:hypothetical protein
MVEADQRVTVVDLRIPFFRLVWFFVKLAFAAIVAAIVLAFILTVIAAIVTALTGGHVDVFMRRWTL